MTDGATVSRFLAVCSQQSALSDQCDLGVRFLDLRVARKPAGGSKLFFAHGIYTLMTVKVCAWMKSLEIDCDVIQRAVNSCVCLHTGGSG